MCRPLCMNYNSVKWLEGEKKFDAVCKNLISSAFLCRILDHIEEGKKAKQVDNEEGENVKQQVDMYMAAKKAIEEQRRKVCSKTCNVDYRSTCWKKLWAWYVWSCTQQNVFSSCITGSLK